MKGGLGISTPAILQKGSELDLIQMDYPCAIMHINNQGA